MLVLSRKPGERVQIGDDVELVVIAVRGDQVRLGFAAPRDIVVCRAELLARVRGENEAAARAASRVRRAESDELAAPARGRLKPDPLRSDITSGAPSRGRLHTKPERRARAATT